MDELRGDEEVVESDGRRLPLRQALAESSEPLRRFLWRLSGDGETARDLAQEAMVKALLGFRNYRGDSSFRTWLFAIAANLYRDTRRRRRPAALEDAEDLNDAGAEAGLMERRLDAQRAWALLPTLPASKRKALVLRLEFGHSYEEIARILACPVGTVRSRIHAGLEELRAAMGAQDGRKR
jgi:RNA polymerase sigma-70 factor (ECF subfamily)